jgi:hypothetical protein
LAGIENSGRLPLGAALEPERSRAIVRLRDRYAGDRLSLDEFSVALDAVLAAETADALRRASPDVGPPAPPSSVAWLGADLLQPHLSGDETLLWVGRPEAGLARLGAREALIAAAALVFLVFWETTAATGGAPTFFLLWGVVVLGGICYQLFGRLIVSRRRTLYAITTTRVIRLLWRASGDRVDATVIRSIATVSLATSARGRGTITFGDPAPRLQRRGGSFGTAYADDQMRFVNIANVDAVARLIASLQAREADSHPRRRTS